MMLSTRSISNMIVDHNYFDNSKDNPFQLQCRLQETTLYACFSKTQGAFIFMHFSVVVQIYKDVYRCIMHDIVYWCINGISSEQQCTKRQLLPF